MKILEEIARELDGDAPGILYRQDLAAILRKMAAEHGEDDRVRKDAERYRWLRAEGVSYYSTGIIPDLVWQGPDWHDIDGPEKLDQAIDAAMNGANA